MIQWIMSTVGTVRILQNEQERNLVVTHTPDVSFAVDITPLNKESDRFIIRRHTQSGGYSLHIMTLIYINRVTWLDRKPTKIQYLKIKIKHSFLMDQKSSIQRRGLDGFAQRPSVRSVSNQEDSEIIIVRS